MKRALKIFVVSLMIIACLGTVSVFAAGQSKDLMAYVEENMPDAYKKNVIPQLEKIADQLDISEAQNTQLKGIIDSAAAAIKDKGQSLHTYTIDDINFVISTLDQVAGVLGLTYSFTPSTAPTHAGDTVCCVYKDGVLLGRIDLDIGLAKTGIGVEASTWILLFAAVAVVAGGATVYARSRKKVQ